MFDVAGLSEKEWRYSLQQHDAIPKKLDELLQQRLLAVTRRTLAADLQILANLGWLKRSKNKKYCRVDSFPTRAGSQKTISPPNQSQLETLFQVLDLDKLMLLYPEVAPLADDLSKSVKDENERRVFFHLDYILPDETKDEVDNLQYKLQKLWQSSPISPVLLSYESAKQGKIFETIVYPVCIYYVQRAKYLCAYGETPKGAVDWYNYRLDRIGQLKKLAWTDSHIPKPILQQYKNGMLPNPSYMLDRISSKSSR